jgi:hypothetical protein
MQERADLEIAQGSPEPRRHAVLVDQHDGGPEIAQMRLERGAHGVDRGLERLEIGLAVGPEGSGDAAYFGRGDIVLHLLLPARGADRAETGCLKTVGVREIDQLVGDEDLHLSRRRHVRRDLQ